MGIDISQWGAVIGRNKPVVPKDMTKSKKREHMRTKEATQETIRNESLHFWKNAIILVSLGVWFFFAHSLPGDGMSSEKMSSSGTAVKVHILLHMHIFIYGSVSPRLGKMSV